MMMDRGGRGAGKAPGVFPKAWSSFAKAPLFLQDKGDSLTDLSCDDKYLNWCLWTISEKGTWRRKNFALPIFTGKNEELSSFAKEMDGSNGKHLQDPDETGKRFNKIFSKTIRINL